MVIVVSTIIYGFNVKTVKSQLSFNSGRQGRNNNKMADQVEKISRPMKFPYTFSAKLAQFPYKHYFKNQWVWKYYAIAVVCCIPVFNSISKLANSPENVAKWAEIRRKEAAEHHH